MQSVSRSIHPSISSTGACTDNPTFQNRPASSLHLSASRSIINCGDRLQYKIQRMVGRMLERHCRLYLASAGHTCSSDQSDQYVGAMHSHAYISMRVRVELIGHARNNM